MSEKTVTGFDMYNLFYQQYLGEGKTRQTAKRMAVRAAGEMIDPEEMQQIMTDTIPAQSAEQQSELDAAYRTSIREGKDHTTAMRMAKTYVES